MSREQRQSKSSIVSDAAWQWDVAERERLNSRYKTGLLRCLKALEDYRASGHEIPRQLLSRLAKEFDEAGDLLDHCASNCHAMSATCCVFAGKSPMRQVGDEDAVRLRTALGDPVVMTRTTIAQLQGRIMSLADLNGLNGIVQYEGEYWGTPVDRLLVLLPGSDDVAEMLAKESVVDHSAIHVSPETRAFLNGYTSGNTRTTLIVQPAAYPSLVLVQNAEAGVNEFVPIEVLPPDLQLQLSETSRDDADRKKGPETDFRFVLRDGELSNAIQFLTMTGRNGVLHLTFTEVESSDNGDIYVANGRIPHVELGKKEGVQALARMLRLGKCIGAFEDDISAAHQSVSLNTDQLLIEAAVMADEEPR